MTRQDVASQAVMAVLTSVQLKAQTKSMIMRAFYSCGMELYSTGVIIYLNSGDELRLTDEVTMLKLADDITITDNPIGKDRLHSVRELAKWFADMGSPTIEGDIQTVLKNPNLPQDVADYVKKSNVRPVTDDYDGKALYKVDRIAALLEESIYDEYSLALSEMMTNTNVTHIAI